MLDQMIDYAFHFLIPNSTKILLRSVRNLSGSIGQPVKEASTLTTSSTLKTFSKYWKRESIGLISKVVSFPKRFLWAEGNPETAHDPIATSFWETARIFFNFSA